MVLPQITVRRGALLEDAYAALRDVGGSIRGRLVVAFVNEAGLEVCGSMCSVMLHAWQQLL